MGTVVTAVTLGMRQNGSKMVFSHSAQCAPYSGVINTLVRDWELLLPQAYNTSQCVACFAGSFAASDPSSARKAAGARSRTHRLCDSLPVHAPCKGQGCPLGGHRLTVSQQCLPHTFSAGGSLRALSVVG